MNDDLKQQLYLIADEMRGMAGVQKHFASDPYELERAENMMVLAAKVAALGDSEMTPDEIQSLFFAEPWLRFSPAIGVDAFVLNDDAELLLIQRADNQHWAMPGGLSEIGFTPAETAVKELWEEAGLRGEVKRLLGVFDARIWGTRSKVHLLNMVFVLECNDLTPNIGMECVDYGFFAVEDLPMPLHSGHDTRIPCCFEMVYTGETYFDEATAEHMELPYHQRPTDDAMDD